MYKRKDIFIIGTSLGGNTLANILPEYDLNEQIKGAVMCQPPLDLLKVKSNLENSLNGFYTGT